MPEKKDVNLKDEATPQELRKPPAEKEPVETRDAEEPAGPTPIWISRRTRNLVLGFILVLFLLLMWAAPSAVVMTLGGVTLALILSFPTQALSRFMPRGLAILASFLLMLGIFGLGISFLVPLLLDQLSSFVAAIPGLVQDANQTLRSIVAPLAENDLLPGTPEEFVANLNENLLNLAQNLAQNVLGGLGGFVSGTVNVGLALFGIFFIAAYLLVDVRRVRAAVVGLAPGDYRRDAEELWESLGFSLSRYLSGLGLVMFIQGALSAAALFLLGVPYALLVGVWVSVTAVIPLLGAWLGAVPAVILALSISPVRALIVALLFFLIQQFEGNVLTPRVQGQVLNIHPILIFLAVIVGGELAGLLGVVFAVPALAVLKVLADFFSIRLRTTD